PDYRELASSRIKQSLGEGKPAPLAEEKFIRLDGTPIDVQVSATPFSYAGKPAMLTVFNDITARKRAEEALLKLGKAVDTSGEVIFMADREGIITFVNPEFTHLYGYTANEVIGKTTPRILKSGVMNPQDYEYFWKTLLNKQTVKGELINKTKDGRLLTIEGSVNPILDEQEEIVGFLAIQRDITGRKRAAEALRESEARYRTLVETSSDGITMTNFERRILMCNPRTSALHGFDSPEEMIGLDVFDLIAPEDRQRALDNSRRTREAKGVGVAEYTLLRKDGSRFLGELSTSLIVDAEGKPHALMGLTRDITEGKQAAEQIERQLHRLAALREIDTAIAGSMDLHVTLEVILPKVLAQLNVDAADVLLLNQQTLTLEYAAGCGFRSAALRHTRLRLGEGIAGRAALERNLVSIPNLSGAIDDQACSPLLSREEFVTYHVVPLFAKGQVNGVLEVFHRTAFAANQEWLDFLQVLAGQTALAIDNAALFTDLQRSNTELAVAYDSTIEGWSRALDLRDKETEGHTQRVTEITMRLARAMGVGDAELVHMRHGALLHDIGKMGVPDSILLKPDKLTDAEWVTMRQHPQLAYDMLSPINYLHAALDIPYCHHEKWDGTGYPRGLKGEQIPLAARVFAIVDVWDALRSDRPYRKAWARDTALEHIRGLAGTHFDPKVVEEFLKVDL
ncbi:MAG: PAS domain S-box protein, partial [Chloroflexota bacterium]|nr:PAS domain S-box protein [Chloroflexota bacterium]